MSNDSPVADRATVPRRRVQFTVRTFLAAAVLVAFFGAASGLPDRPEGLQLAAFAVLIWLTLAGIYYILHARAALVASVVGVLAAVVGIGILGAKVGILGDKEGTPAEALLGTIAFSSAWGAGYSVVILLVRGVQHLWRSASASTAPRVPATHEPPREAPRLALVMAALQLLVPLQVLTVSAGLNDPSDFALGEVVVADMPVAAFYLAVVFNVDFAHLWLAVFFVAVLSIPFHGLLGYLVGYVLDRRSRRRPLRQRGKWPSRIDGRRESVDQ